MSRRKNGEGTIYRRQRCRRRAHHGGSRCGGRCRCLWVGELTLGYEGGRRIKKTYANKDLAALQRALNNGKFIIDNVNAADGAGLAVDDKGYTVASWVSYWLDTYKRPTIKLSTLGCYRDTLEYYITPHIGGLALGSVTADDIQRLYNRLFDSGLSSSTIKKVHAVLCQAYNQAVSAELVRKNPCLSAVLPRSSSRKSAALTEDEQRAFVASCPRSVYGDFFIFALNTGLRRGEILALTWKDVDFVANAITVDKASYVVKGKDGKRCAVVQTPKTRSGLRTIPINATVKTLILRRFRACENELAADGRRNGDNAANVNPAALVFGNAKGGFLSYRNIRRALSVVVKRADIKYAVTVHSLRHTFTTRLLEKGADAKTVSELLGHANVKLTLEVYAHITPNTRAAAVALLDG